MLTESRGVLERREKWKADGREMSVMGNRAVAPAENKNIFHTERSFSVKEDISTKPPSAK